MLDCFQMIPVLISKVHCFKKLCATSNVGEFGAYIILFGYILQIICEMGLVDACYVQLSLS